MAEDPASLVGGSLPDCRDGLREALSYLASGAGAAPCPQWFSGTVSREDRLV